MISLSTPRLSQRHLNLSNRERSKTCRRADSMLVGVASQKINSHFESFQGFAMQASQSLMRCWH